MSHIHKNLVNGIDMDILRRNMFQIDIINLRAEDVYKRQDQSPLPRFYWLLWSRPSRDAPVGLCPLYPAGGLQLVHPCAGTEGGTVRNLSRIHISGLLLLAKAALGMAETIREDGFHIHLDDLYSINAEGKSILIRKEERSKPWWKKPSSTPLQISSGGLKLTAIPSEPAPMAGRSRRFCVTPPSRSRARRPAPWWDLTKILREFIKDKQYDI